jgi:hypothetical protein
VDQDATAAMQALLDKGADFSMVCERLMSGLLSKLVAKSDWPMLVRVLGSHAGDSGKMVQALNTQVPCKALEPVCHGDVPMVLVPARLGQHATTALMIERGADASALNESGVGALLIAVELRDVEMIRTLLTLTAGSLSLKAQQASMLEARAPRLELRSAAITALGLAVLFEYEDCAAVLREFGAPETDAEEIPALFLKIDEEQATAARVGARSIRRRSMAMYDEGPVSMQEQVAASNRRRSTAMYSTTSPRPTNAASGDGTSKSGANPPGVDAAMLAAYELAMGADSAGGGAGDDVADADEAAGAGGGVGGVLEADPDARARSSADDDRLKLSLDLPPPKTEDGGGWTAADGVDGVDGGAAEGGDSANAESAGGGEAGEAPPQQNQEEEGGGPDADA